MPTSFLVVVVFSLIKDVSFFVLFFDYFFIHYEYIFMDMCNVKIRT